MEFREGQPHLPVHGIQEKLRLIENVALNDRKAVADALDRIYDATNVLKHIGESARTDMLIADYQRLARDDVSFQKVLREWEYALLCKEKHYDRRKFYKIRRIL